VPGENVSRNRPKAASRKIIPWAAEQVDAVHNGLPEPWQALVGLGSGLGLRQGECFGLAVEDIDFLRRVSMCAVR
jgi:hypothetical protein